MKVYTLMENTLYCQKFAAEHGLSLYIETKKYKILFDTGQSGTFAKNAVLLGIDLKKQICWYCPMDIMTTEEESDVF